MRETNKVDAVIIQIKAIANFVVSAKKQISYPDVHTCTHSNKVKS